MANQPAKIKCSLCGAEFECGAQTGNCWCTSLPNVMPVDGDSCWCAKCLEEKIAEQENKV